jgi:hypothetical protein
MMRSLSTSALVLALVVPLAACGGGGSDPPKDPSDPAAGGGTETPSSGDPVADAQAVADDIQKAVDLIFQPIKDSDVLITSLGTLSADLKAAKSKIDPKKALAEIKKATSGGTASVDALKAKDDDPGKAIVQDRIDKVKALFASLDGLDQKLKDLGQKITDGVPKITASVAKALPKLTAKISAPFGVSAEDKKKATEDKEKLTALVDSFKTKGAEWTKLIADLPVKAKALPDKFAAIK